MVSMPNQTKHERMGNPLNVIKSQVLKTSKNERLYRDSVTSIIPDSVNFN